MSTHLNLPARAGAGVRAMAARRAASVPEGKAPISLVRPTATGRLRALRAGGGVGYHGAHRCSRAGVTTGVLCGSQIPSGGGQFMTTPGAAFKALN